MRHLTLFCLVVACSICIAQQDTINIDLGNTGLSSPLPWNNVTNTNIGAASDLFTQAGFTTGMEIVVTDTFNGINSSGNVPDPALGISVPGAADSFFGSTVPAVGGHHPLASVTLFHLDTARTFSFGLFASRNATDNRETKYVVVGTTQDSAFLDVASNTSDIVYIGGIKPKADSTITIYASAGPNNTNVSGYYYLGAIRMSYSGPPITGTKTLSLDYPNGGEFWEIGATPLISWTSTNVVQVDIDYSEDNGNNWTTVANGVSGLNGSYLWTIPPTPSSDCLVRITDATDGSIVDVSDANFQIVPDDTTSYHVVVLGSSTAAGTGPSTLDSAWVWRYERYLTQKDTRFELSNLAVGGFTTYSILPTGTPIPTGVNQTVQVNNNVTMALSLNPDAVIINLPSNDAANNFPVVDQLANYALITNDLAAQNVPVWVTTPQPRNNFNGSQTQIQLDMVDSTFSVFGNKAIDFWSGFHDSSFGLDPLFDSGDGVHANDLAHRIFFERVVDAGICQNLLNIVTSVPAESAEPDFLVFPNPSNQFIQLMVPSSWTWDRNMKTQLIDSGGRIVLEAADASIINVQELPSGMYTLRLFSTHGVRTAVVLIQR